MKLLSVALLSWITGLGIMGLGIMGLAVPVQDVSARETGTGQAEDIRRISAWLRELVTMDSRFVQLSGGSVARGRIRLWRPGRIRIDYDPPAPIRIVARGGFLLYYDMELEQASYVPVSETPAWFLLRDTGVLGEGVAVTGYGRDGNIIRLTLTQRDKPEEGAVTLVFRDRPLHLERWEIVDSQGVQINVALVTPQFDVIFPDPEIFSTVDPRFLQRQLD